MRHGARLAALLIMGAAGGAVAQPAGGPPTPPGADMYAPPAGGWGPPPGAPSGPSEAPAQAAPPAGGGYGDPAQGATPPGAYGGPNAAGGYGGPGQGAHPHLTMRQRFEAANTAHDGRLTLEQAEASHMPRIVQNFQAIDRDRKGYVTLQDLHEWMQARRAARAAGEGGAPPP